MKQELISLNTEMRPKFYNIEASCKSVKSFFVIKEKLSSLLGFAEAEEDVE